MPKQGTCSLKSFACLCIMHAPSCTIVSQYDVIKFMLQKPILSSRLEKWAYDLVEYYFKYETLRARKGQVVADFIVDHNIELDHDVCMGEGSTRKLFFDGSMCSSGQGVGCFIVFPNEVEHEKSTWLEFECTNNQVEYEALLNGQEMMVDMRAKSIEAYGESKLVVQQMNGENQCLHEVLNEYQENAWISWIVWKGSASIICLMKIM
jgi:hypothetical protein